MRVKLLVNLRGTRQTFKAGKMFDSAVEAIPREILQEISANRGTVEVQDIHWSQTREPDWRDEQLLLMHAAIDGDGADDMTDNLLHALPDDNADDADGVAALSGENRSVQFAKRSDIYRAKKQLLVAYLRGRCEDADKLSRAELIEKAGEVFDAAQRRRPQN